MVYCDNLLHFIWKSLNESITVFFTGHTLITTIKPNTSTITYYGNNVRMILSSKHIARSSTSLYPKFTHGTIALLVHTDTWRVRMNWECAIHAYTLESYPWEATTTTNCHNINIAYKNPTVTQSPLVTWTKFPKKFTGFFHFLFINIPGI